MNVPADASPAVAWPAEIGHNQSAGDHARNRPFAHARGGLFQFIIAHNQRVGKRMNADLRKR
jgi:hypothetical protein